MAIDINSIVEIDPNNDEHRLLLEEIQGNILKSHGRNHAVHLLLSFEENKVNEVKQWIRNFTEIYVTSALKQADQAEQFRNNDAGYGNLFANFFLTRSGYMYLGVSYEDLPQENEFRKGMKDSNSALGDPPVEQWEAGFQNEHIHAFVLIAGDKAVGSRTEDAKIVEQQDPSKLKTLPSLLGAKVQKIKDDLKDIAGIVQEDEGFVLRDLTTGGIGEPIEHFGFRDGVSQPLFLKRDIEAAKAKNNGNFSEWNPSAPLSLVLFKDPLGKNNYSYGSFLVYRKLEQNVPGWNEDVTKLADTLDVDSNLAGAYTMGRFQDGTPVLLSNTPNSDPKKLNNNFNYANDPQGSKCPFHAHIRKTNPRGDTQQPPIRVPLEEEKAHRIVRRGINYGQTDRTKATETGSGLLFLCFQASIANQFGFIQEAWANRNDFIKQNVGTDPVIGLGQADTEEYTWPATWDSNQVKLADFSHWVTMKGGEYFFAPSMNYLRSLAESSIKDNDVINECEYIIHELKEYQDLNWAIGTNPRPGEQDRFVAFFEEQKLNFKPYALTPEPVGTADAYQDNINELVNKIHGIDPDYKLYLD